MKVPHTKFDINQTINDRVRAETFHCSNLARQKWAKFGPTGPKIFLYVTFVRKVPHTKFDINPTINDRVRAETFHCSNLASQKWGKFWARRARKFF